MNTILKRAVLAADDGHFGPSSRTFPDFTLSFEEGPLTTGPAAVLLFLTPFYLWHYLSLPVVSAEEPLIFAKLVGQNVCLSILLGVLTDNGIAAAQGTNILLVALQIVSAVLYEPLQNSRNIAIVSSVMSCLAAVSLAALMHFEHRRALESSPLPAVYLFVTLLIDAAKTRSYFLREVTPLGGVMAAIAVAKFTLLVLGELPKQYQIESKTLGVEARHGFWGRTFFVWINSTLLLGFRNILSVDALPNLDRSFASTHLAATFKPIWLKQNSSSHKLLRATFWSSIWSFLGVVPARLLYSGFSFAEPFLLRSILQYVDQGERDSDVERGLIGAIALARLGVTVTRVWYNLMNNRLLAKTRGMLASQILDKSLLLDRHEAKRAAAVSLMNTDINGIMMVLPLLHETWAGIVEVGISVYLLSIVVEKSAFLVIFPATIAGSLALEVGRRTLPATKLWNEHVEGRISKTSQILSSLIGIKMMAAEQAVGDYVQKLRVVEIGYSKKVRKLGILTNLALRIGYSFTPVLVMAGALFWSGFDNGFNATNAFTTLAFVFLAARPIANILHSWSSVGGFIACFQRIEAYLSLPERVDSRQQQRVMHDDCSKSQDKTFPASESSPLLDVQRFPIQLQNATIASADGRTLFTANLSFSRSTTTMVIGPTGVGKSTLLRALLGEADIMDGSVFVQPQRIAYCDQEEWIRNITIRDNIIGENDYDEEWYTRVIESCLLRDIEEFPRGHLSLAGSRGANLSGGQRQRVALGRAIYSRAGIILLDDCLSAVDRPSAFAILKQLIGPSGILRSLGSTIVMSTHSVEFLKSADSVLVIHNDGVVTTETAKQAIQRYEGLDFLDADYDDEDISDGGSRDDSAARHYVPPAPKPKASTELRQTGDVSLYKYYLQSVSRRVLVPWLFVAIMVTLTEKMPAVYVRIWVDKDPNNNFLFVGYALVPVAGMIATALWTWISYIYLIPESGERLHKKLLIAIQSATLSFLTYTDSGSLLNRFSQDMSLIMQELPMAFLFFSYNLFGMLTNMAIIASAAQYAATLLPFIFAVLYSIQMYYLRTSRQMRLLDVEAKSPISTHLTETSEGIHHIRAFGWEQQYLSKGLGLLDYSQKPFYYMYCIQRWLGLVLDLTVSAIGVVLVALAVSLSSTNKAALGLGLLKIMEIGPELAILINFWVSLETSLGAVARVRAFEKETPQERDDDDDNDEEAKDNGYDNTNNDLDLPHNWPQRGQISLENVSAYYSIDDTDYKALDEVSVEVASGTKVGIVGRSGSGKSSLHLTLLNMLKFTGSITIDGVDITTIPRRVLRSRITTISQELVELPSSVRDNLVPLEIMAVPAERTDDTRLLGSLEKVGLRTVVETRGGLDKPISEVGLSGGERQLLALARALLHHGRTNSKVVLVDEATSSLDYSCEDKLKEVMTEAFEDCTVLTIAHRHHTVQNTTLLELSAGRLVSYD